MRLGPGGKPLVVVSTDLERRSAAMGGGSSARFESFGTLIFSKSGTNGGSGSAGAYRMVNLSSGRGYEVVTRWLPDLPPDVVSTLIGAYDDNRTLPFSSIILHHFHGAAARVAPGDNSIRHAGASLHRVDLRRLGVAWMSTQRIIVAAAQDLSSKLSRWALPGGYANLLDDDAREQIGSAYGPNAQRLLDLKSRFDPGKLFSAIPLPSR